MHRHTCTRKRRAILDQADPPDTKYATGDLDMDAAAQASFPVAPQFRAFLPLSVDLSFRMPKVGDQGNANSCVAWALGYAVRSYYSVALENRDNSRQENIPSPGYIYNVAKQLANAKKCDNGSKFEFNVKVLQKGALSLADYPYHASDCDGAPAPQIIASAKDFRIRGARMLDHKKLDDIKGALAQSNPVVISFSADNAFMQHRGAGVFANTVADKASAGWHAIAVVGYDDRKQAFRLINSWGTGWGDGGYGWVGYNAHYQPDSLCRDNRCSSAAAPRRRTKAARTVSRPATSTAAPPHARCRPAASCAILYVAPSGRRRQSAAGSRSLALAPQPPWPSGGRDSTRAAPARSTAFAPGTTYAAGGRRRSFTAPARSTAFAPGTTHAAGSRGRSFTAGASSAIGQSKS